jgi:transcriptional regulator with GAF, ATPase, and Fis domain
METELIGISQNIRQIKELINQVADTDLNIVVSGETGVGKEVVVRSLYQQSKRAGKPFIKVNCAALPDTLVESEMFGYEKGAFTGAQQKMRGKFEQANGGVLFLDEIGDMPLALQSKLLHALQDGDFTPLGSEKAVVTDAWVIAATNHNLEDNIEKGNFRADLYHRLNTMEIYIESLRKRPEDIPPLINYYYEIYASQFKGKQLRALSKSTVDKLTAYQWPGNVRELQNVLKRIFILGEKEETTDMLINTKNTQTLRDRPQTIVDWPSVEDENEPQLSSLSLKAIKTKVMDRIEKEVISYVLMKSNWNRSQAARILNISYKTILNKIRDFNIKTRPQSGDKIIKFPHKHRIDSIVTESLNKFRNNDPHAISGRLPETLTSDL